MARKPSSRAKVIPSYEAIKHTGIAAGDDSPTDSLAPYDVARFSGVSTVSQTDGLAEPSPTPATTSAYQTLDNAGGDMSPHGIGPKTPGTPSPSGANPGGGTGAGSGFNRQSGNVT